MFAHSILSLVVLVCFVASATATERSLLGDRLYSLLPENEAQLKLLNRARETNSVENGLDFWESPSRVGQEVRIHVPSHLVTLFLQFVEKHGFQMKLLHKNLLEIVEAEAFENGKKAGLHGRYMRHAEINDFLESTAKTCGSRCSLQTIGQSYEKRDMKIIKIGNNPNNKIVWIDGGIHAREWISPATVVYFIDKLVNNYNSDSKIKSLCDTYNFHILPVHNPDGYDYTHSSSSNRYWRKTRSKSLVCYGVDPNRNFGYKFGGQGTSGYSCSDIYRGSKAFSEVETAAVRDYVISIKNRTKVFLTVHSYGQYFLLPYGYANNIYPDNYDDMYAAAKVAADKIRNVNNRRKYTYGHSANMLYPAAGASDDWGRSIGIPYAFCIELPDNGTHGFNLPASYIKPVGEETLAGVAAMLEFVKNK